MNQKTSNTAKNRDVMNTGNIEKNGNIRNTDIERKNRSIRNTENVQKNSNIRNTENVRKNGNIRNTTKTAVLTGVMAAVICVMGPLSIPIPISPVPISLTNLAVFLAIYVLGMKKGSISYLIYLLIGFVGLPVFASFSAGPGVLLGPTGGYLIGFIFMAAISGLFIEKWPTNRYLCFIGMVLGMLVCYLFGTLWLAQQAGISFYAAFATGVVPFLPGDLAKIIATALVAPKIRGRLSKAGVVEDSN